MQLNDLERAHLNRVRSRITDALAQALILATELRTNHDGRGADHVDEAIVDLKRAKAEVDALAG